MSEQPSVPQSSRRFLDIELDKLEADIERVRILYEQFFVDVVPARPEKEHKLLSRKLRELMAAPFKNSQTRFRLKNIYQRYQTLNTYWERVLKQREEGTYSRDVFRADMREMHEAEDEFAGTEQGALEKGIKQLYGSYEKAVRQSGASTNNMDYDRFKKSLVEKAKQLKQQHGVKKIKYKIVSKNGRVVVKATAKE